MRIYGALSPTDGNPLPPDTVQTFLMTGGSSVQAGDWANSTVGSSAVAAQLVHFSGVTTGGALLNFWVNLTSTRASVPSSGLSTDGSTIGVPVQGNRTFQIPGGSTGFSIAALTSGYVQASLWRR